MKDLAKKRVEEPVAIENITKATKTNSYSFDPSYVLDEDIYLPCGKLLYTKGHRVNPLDHMEWNDKMIFIDGRDRTQVAWVKAHYLQEKKILVNEEEIVGRFNDQSVNKNEEVGIKIILIGGKPLDIEEEVNIPVYFDQFGQLTQKFNITHVPATIEQDGKYLKVTEINIDEKI